MGLSDLCPLLRSALTGGNVRAMKPARWIERTGRTIFSFAREMDVGRPTVWKYVTGKMPPSIFIMGLFHEASGGKVALRDWLLVYPEWRSIQTAAREKAKKRWSKKGKAK